MVVDLAGSVENLKCVSTLPWVIMCLEMRVRQTTYIRKKNRKLVNNLGSSEASEPML